MITLRLELLSSRNDLRVFLKTGTGTLHRRARFSFATWRSSMAREYYLKTVTQKHPSMFRWIEIVATSVLAPSYYQCSRRRDWEAVQPPGSSALRRRCGKKSQEQSRLAFPSLESAHQRWERGMGKVDGSSHWSNSLKPQYSRAFHK